MSEQPESTEPGRDEAVVVVAADRMCGRCRRHFPADPRDVTGTQPDWWLCQSCRAVLFGDEHPSTDDGRP